MTNSLPGTESTSIPMVKCLRVCFSFIMKLSTSGLILVGQSSWSVLLFQSCTSSSNIRQWQNPLKTFYRDSLLKLCNAMLKLWKSSRRLSCLLRFRKDSKTKFVTRTGNTILETLYAKSPQMK